MTGKPDSVKADYAESSQAHILRLHGDVRYGDVIALQQFISQLSRPVKPFRIDLTRCSHLDSTALGTLALVAKLGKETGVSKPEVLVREGVLLETLLGVCFDLVFRLSVTEQGIESADFSEIEPLNTVQPDSLETLQNVVSTAHQSLADISEKNTLIFKDVNLLLSALAKKE
ncbi:STAS domain-containing protein [Pleionea litopenaei]|uniref:STAS domain-containing protein n=1 Tax=Pleionea litopenaei TaxID=3070815 RepID=A0AA51RV36_9GAMM|nr:STAS domain-containing protein [Pleionea sp. HL-JVS1]WMS88142.1 STAS domain-containing protein [Pleionea sp. HL-JVS1]